MSGSSPRGRPSPAGSTVKRPLPDKPAADIFPVLGRAWPADGFGPISTIAAQLPDPNELPPGGVVLVREAGPPGRGFGRWLTLWRRKKRADTAVRCTALLARGYRDIGAALDPRTGEEVAWGSAATSGRSS